MAACARAWTVDPDAGTHARVGLEPKWLCVLPRCTKWFAEFDGWQRRTRGRDHTTVGTGGRGRTRGREHTAVGMLMMTMTMMMMMMMIHHP